MTTNIAVVITTVGSEDEATNISDFLIDNNLAACIQEIAIKSRYRWQGNVVSEPEILLLAKTASDRVEAAVTAIQERHSYDIPEIVVLPVVDGLPDYLTWVVGQTREDNSRH